MSKKSASPAASQHSATTINTDVSIMKLVDIKGETRDQFKTIEKVNTSPHLYLNLATSPHMYLNVDASSLASTQHNAPSVRSVLISKHKSSDFAPPTDNAQPPEPAAITTTDKKTLKIWPAVKSLNEIQRSESVSLTSERNQKNKHHHHHRRHYQHNRKRRHSCHHHHRHSYHPRSNSVEEQRKQTNRPSPKVIIANSKPSTPQKPVLVYRRILNNKGYTVNADTVANVSQEANRESIVSNNQQEPLIIYQDSNIPQNVKMNKNVSPVIVDQNRTSILQQYDSSVCMPQQQQQQILLCSDPTTTQDFVCSSSNCNFVQQIPCQQQQQQQQQQYICIDNTSPTIINQLPVCNSISTSTQPQSYLCVSQTSSPQSASIVIQQPSQMSAQPIQFIQNPQQQTGQYLKISSASPQVIQAIPSPGLGSIQPQIIQTVQAPAQTITASPQILYQRPYDPIVVPVQNQQFSLATTPAIGLSQPCYIPQSRVNNGPRLFQHALARAVSDRTGMPSCLPPSTDIQIPQRPFSHAFDGGRLASTAKGPISPFNIPNCSIM
ncbi:hypothetical protein I4U23_030042 [Adineta vaga]|nr:hypothetical protein I4U23_030042 [Adineta vaga]